MSISTTEPAPIVPEADASVAAAPPPPSVGEAVREYVARVRGGDVGPLPAILGLLVLLVVFSALRPSTFTN